MFYHRPGAQEDRGDDQSDHHKDPGPDTNPDHGLSWKYLQVMDNCQNILCCVNQGVFYTLEPLHKVCLCMFMIMYENQG